jgi:hypothetical protein
MYCRGHGVYLFSSLMDVDGTKGHGENITLNLLQPTLCAIGFHQCPVHYHEDAMINCPPKRRSRRSHEGNWSDGSRKEKHEWVVAMVCR